MSDPDALWAFQEHDVVIPMTVIEELDNHKSRMDEVGVNARQVARSLDELRSIGNLGDGVSLGENKGVLTIRRMWNGVHASFPQELQNDKNDNTIIAFVYELQSQLKDDPNNLILVSKDVNVRIKCDALGIISEDYRHNKIVSSTDELYTGVSVVMCAEVSIDALYASDVLSTDTLKLERRLFPNEIIVLKAIGVEPTKSVIARYDSHTSSLKPIRKFEHVFGLKPRNKEQGFSLDVLMDPSIKLVTLTGAAGTGKTLLALAAGLAQTKTVGNQNTTYEKLVVSRPIQPLGKDIGFLPGTLAEKMEPWVAPIRDNISFLFSSKGSNKGARKQKPDTSYVRLLQENGVIEVEAITFIRGRSIPNSFIIIDEAQNITPHELKTIITRAGDNTKIVLTGDIEQIDNTHVDAYSNGLSYAIEKFKDSDLAAHVTLLKGERSPLATYASKVL